MEYTLGARAASNLRSVLFRKIKICINYSNSMNHYSKFFKSETTLYWIIWKKLNPSLFFLQKYYIHGTKELEKYWRFDVNAKLEIASAKGIKEYISTTRNFKIRCPSISNVFKTKPPSIELVQLLWIFGEFNYRYCSVQNYEISHLTEDFGKPSQLLISQLFVELKFVNSTFANSTFNYGFYIQNS